MIYFPNAKINIGLNILNKREDGFHNIESCFYPIPWHDILEINLSDKLSFTSSGINIPGDSESNLCIKAYNLITKDFNISPVTIHLHKLIPIGAGMGGGSSDAAFTLKGLNELFGLNLSINQLEAYAKQLGSDCAFFIQNKPTLAFNKGDEFININITLKKLHLVAVYPSVHISTKEAYSNISFNTNNTSLESLLSSPLELWQETIKNDFEQSIFPNHQELKDIKNQLIKMGAIYSSMTGSGSTVFGLFYNAPKTEDLFSDSFITKTMNLI